MHTCWLRMIPLAAVLAALHIAGCSTTKEPTKTTRLGPTEKDALVKRAKAPQTFGLTAYSSDDGAVFAGAFRTMQNQMGRVPLAADKNSTAPIIPVNDAKTRMLIDTTAAESWITVEASVRLNTTALAGPGLFEKNARHIYDPTGGFAAVLPRFALEKLLVNEGVFYVRNTRGPLEGLTRWERSPHLDGVLGADFVRAFEFVRISLRGRQVVFSASSVYPYQENAMVAIPLSNLQGGLAAECVLDGERQLTLIDIAGDFEIALDQPDRPGLRQVTLGDVVFRQVEVVSTYDLGLGTNSPPRIGRQLLERYDLVFNQRGRQLLLEVPTR